MNTEQPPLKPFAEERWKMNNLDFTTYNGMPLIVGQKVYGTWVNFDGRTFGTSGQIIYNEITGFWVEDEGGGITEVKLFWQLNFEPANLES